MKNFSFTADEDADDESIDDQSTSGHKGVF